MNNTFKTQQEIWKHLADGGAVQDKHDKNNIVRFVEGGLSDSYSFTEPDHWHPYIEPPRKECRCQASDVAPLRKQRTFYRRKWLIDNGCLITGLAACDSKERYDEVHSTEYSDAKSDEWEEITIEVPEETK